MIWRRYLGYYPVSQTVGGCLFYTYSQHVPGSPLCIHQNYVYMYMYLCMLVFDHTYQTIAIAFATGCYEAFHRHRSWWNDCRVVLNMISFTAGTFELISFLQ